MVLFCSIIPLQLDPFCTTCTSFALCCTRRSYCLQQHAHTMHLSPVHVPLHQVLLQLELFSGPLTHHLPSVVDCCWCSPCLHPRCRAPVASSPASYDQPHLTQLSPFTTGSRPIGRSARTRCRQPPPHLHSLLLLPAPQTQELRCMPPFTAGDLQNTTSPPPDALIPCRFWGKISGSAVPWTSTSSYILLNLVLQLNPYT
jgi:hypothetical protein